MLFTSVRLDLDSAAGVRWCWISPPSNTNAATLASRNAEKNSKKEPEGLRRPNLRAFVVPVIRKNVSFGSPSETPHSCLALPKLQRFDLISSRGITRNGRIHHDPPLRGPKRLESECEQTPVPIPGSMNESRSENRGIE